jgi:hypothetical protein
MSDERRNFSRVNFAVPAFVVSTTGLFDVQVLDLSLKGALVSVPTAQGLALGAQCQLHITLNDEGDRIVMGAEVAHLEGTHMGLLCRNIDIDSMTHLRRLVEFHLVLPNMLERELTALIERRAKSRQTPRNRSA